MKKLLCLVMVFIFLPVLVNAEMVSIMELCEQAERMGRWEETYEAHSRTINVDAPVIVPLAETCPIATIERVIPFSDAQVEQIVADGRKTDAHEYELQIGEGEVYEITLRPESSSDQDAMNRVFAGVSQGSVSLTPQGYEMPMTTYYAWEVDPDQIYAEDNPDSADDALAFMQLIMDELFQRNEIDLTHNRIVIYDRLRKVDVRSKMHELPPLEGSPVGHYMITPQQRINGIPVEDYIHLFLTGTEKDEKRTQKQRLAMSKLNPKLYISYHDQDTYSLSASANRIKHVLSDDIPLAPLDDIICTLENEIEAGRIRGVMSLRLCYTMFWYGGEENDVCIYPVWLADCIYSSSSKKEIEFTGYEDENGISIESMPYFKRIVIDAQSAALFDPSSETLEQITCPDYMDWENVK